MYRTLLIAVIVLSVPLQAMATPKNSRLLGGVSFNHVNSAFAYIYSPKGSCSGTLVAPDLILTAAHCLNGKAEDYSVVINNQTVSVRELYFHNNFKHEGSYSLAKAVYDLGILVLTKKIYNTAPLPIVYNLPVSKGSRARLTAFGLSEQSALGSPGDARTGKIIIKQNYQDLIYFDADKSSATSCFGDSGGALLQDLRDGTQWLIGVDIAGSNSADDNGNCILSDGGQSYSVNLQSSYARDFLQSFPDIRYVNWADKAALALTDRLRNEIKIIRKLKTQDARIRLKNLRKHINNLTQLVSADRSASLKKISSLLRNRSNLRSRNQLIINLQKSKTIAFRLKRTQLNQ